MNNAIKSFCCINALAAVLLCGGCNFLDIDMPRTEIGTEKVFANDATAESALAGIYESMVQHGLADGRGNSMSVVGGLCADELQSHLVYLDDFYNGSVAPDNSYLTNNLWGHSYKLIYSLNLALEQLNASPAVSLQTRRQLEGEARFLRAFTYFNLVNLFGHIPLVLTSDYRVNRAIPQSDAALVYVRIVEDLSASEGLLEPDYARSGHERVRVNRWAAKALLARVRLFNREWEEARRESTALIDQTAVFGISADLTGVFLNGSREAIWQLKPVEPGRNTWEATFFIPASLSAPPTTVSILPDLHAAFQPGDLRKTHWMDSVVVGNRVFHYPSKYRIRNHGEPLREYQVVFRLAEQLLIRAEANLHLGNHTAALADLNVLRDRAGLSAIVSDDRTDIMEAIMRERRCEFFAEWGHRWLDLKRWGIATQLLPPLKVGWNKSALWLPIPAIEIQRNPNLVQHDGH